MIKIGTYATLISIAVTIAITIWALINLPETGTFPIHWNAAGEIDRFATKKEFSVTLWSLVAMTSTIGLLFSILPNIAPLRENLLKSSKAYITGWIGILVINVFIVALLAFLAVHSTKPGGESLDIEKAVKPLLMITGVIITILGNYLPKTRQNWFVGIRTPWSLSSADSWEKTHRLAGTLFVISGLLLIISALALPLNWTIVILISAVSIAAIVPIIASFYFWKMATDK